MLSVVITSFDHPEIAAVHVRECMNNTVIPDEIVVVNDHGPENLRDMLLQLDLKTRVVYAYIKDDIPWNYTGGRNLGVWLSRGDYLSMEDCDNIPSYTCYEEALKYLDAHPEQSFITYGKRPRITKEQALTETQDQWLARYKKQNITRARHNDTRMVRRDAYLRIKGNDERFAGKYAWACTDLNRRFMRAGLTEMGVNKDNKPVPVIRGVSAHFFSVMDGGTNVCRCDEKTQQRDAKYSFCHTCGLPVWRKSYANFDMAREADKWGKQNRGHTQSPQGILNFQYSYEILSS